jgi:hypothetical protein
MSRKEKEWEILDEIRDELVVDGDQLEKGSSVEVRKERRR